MTQRSQRPGPRRLLPRRELGSAPEEGGSRIQGFRLNTGQTPPVLPHQDSTAGRVLETVLGRAVDSPLVRGGSAIGTGLITGNVIGFFRVALTAYLLGTRSTADALAAAIGPVDQLNGVLINTMVFAFVPMLTEREGSSRTALFRKLNRVFSRVFLALAVCIALFAPWLMRVLAPGLDANYVGTAVTILRISAFSSLAAGTAALHAAFLFTHRRFAATAFHQASLNLFTIIGA